MCRLTEVIFVAGEYRQMLLCEWTNVQLCRNSVSNIAQYNCCTSRCFFYVIEGFWIISSQSTISYGFSFL